MLLLEQLSTNSTIISTTVNDSKNRNTLKRELNALCDVTIIINEQHSTELQKRQLYTSLLGRTDKTFLQAQGSASVSQEASRCYFACSTSEEGL